MATLHIGLQYSHYTKSGLRKFHQARKRLKRPVSLKKSRLWFIKRLQKLDANPPIFRFMDLPPGLREHVYRKLVVAKPDWSRFEWIRFEPTEREIRALGFEVTENKTHMRFRRNPEPWLNPQVLRVSSVCYVEAQPLMYCENNFRLDMWDKGDWWKTYLDVQEVTTISSKL